jgi:hypothetical protein
MLNSTARKELLMTIKHYVVRTKPCHEAIARANLTALGFEAYVPTVREDIRTRFTRTTTLAPMFPGYIFVSLDARRCRAGARPRMRRAWSSCCPGPTHPTPVPERAMQWVRESEAAGERQARGGARGSRRGR